MRLLLLLSLVAFVHGQQLWNAQNYPNPTRGQFKECGMLTTSNICDPDGILDVASRNRLDYELKQLERRTSQANGRNFCEKKGVTPAMAIAKRVQGGQTQDVKNMANNMLRTWDLDQQCKKSIVIVVSIDDAKFWVARDDKVPVYADEFTQIFQKHASLLKKKQYTEALNGILQSTWETALNKQGSLQPSPGQGGGRQQPTPGFGDTGGRGGGKPFSIPSWIWIALVFIVIPTLCCCCCLYCCCCRGKGSSAPAGRQPVPQDYPAGGGGGGFPPNPSGPTGGGGRFGNFMSTLGGAGVGSMLGNLLSNRNRGGGGGMGMGGMGGMGTGAYGGGDYQGGGAYPAPPQPVIDDNGEGGKGLYPSVSVKDEGGGGSWA